MFKGVFGKTKQCGKLGEAIAHVRGYISNLSEGIAESKQEEARLVAELNHVQTEIAIGESLLSTLSDVKEKIDSGLVACKVSASTEATEEPKS